MEKTTMEENKLNAEIEALSDDSLEKASGGFGYPEVCYKSYMHLVRDRIYFACVQRRSVKPYCPKCGELLKPLVIIQMDDEELHAAHERNHVMCHYCRFEGTDDDWVFSPNNH
jgi:hypothetical protein